MLCLCERIACHTDRPWDSTSGNVPLEKTLKRKESADDIPESRDDLEWLLHEKTSLPASAVTNNNEFAAYLCHTHCSERGCGLGVRKSEDGVD